MKCRALSENKKIVWFKKDISDPTAYYYKIGEESGYITPGQVIKTFPDTITISGVTYSVVPLKYNAAELKLEGAAVGLLSITNKPVASNYAESSQAVADSLTQRLSVIKGELWYQVNYGLPLTEKQRGTNVLDLVIGDIISSHPGVASLDSYKSKLVGHTYYYDCQITSVFGETLTVTNNLTV